MNLQKQADAFRAQKPGDVVDPSWDLLKGMRSFGTDVPAFTYMNDNRFPNLYEDENIVIYLNSALPYPDNEGRAAMSWVHLLTVPKKRIYNVKTLLHVDIALLEYMQKTTRDVFSTSKYREKLFVMLLEQHVRSGAVNDQFIHAMESLRNAKKENLSFWFHEHPYHSVGHLHMHVILDTTLTHAFDIHGSKNVPFDKVIERLRNEEYVRSKPVEQTRGFDHEMLDDTFRGILRDVYDAVKHNGCAVARAIYMTEKPDELSEDQWNTFIEMMSNDIQTMIDESVQKVFSKSIKIIGVE